MGRVVYDAERGDIEKYYKLESSAKSRVTRYNREMSEMNPSYTWRGRRLAYCSYRDYEGILMGSEAKVSGCGSS